LFPFQVTKQKYLLRVSTYNTTVVLLKKQGLFSNKYKKVGSLNRKIKRNAANMVFYYSFAFNILDSFSCIAMPSLKEIPK